MKVLDKYIGDAIVAFYGAPAPVENHEVKSCITALEMQRALADLEKNGKVKMIGPTLFIRWHRMDSIAEGWLREYGFRNEDELYMMGDTVNLQGLSHLQSNMVYTTLLVKIYMSQQKMIIFDFRFCAGQRKNIQ